MVSIDQLRVVAPLRDTPLKIIAEGVRSFTHLFIDLLDDRLLRFLRTVTFSMYLLEELADAGLAGVVDYYYSFDHRDTRWRRAAVWFGVSAVLGLPRARCGVVDGFSAAVVVCRASLCCASTAYASYASSRHVC